MAPVIRKKLPFFGHYQLRQRRDQPSCGQLSLFPVRTGPYFRPLTSFIGTWTVNAQIEPPAPMMIRPYPRLGSALIHIRASRRGCQVVLHMRLNEKT